MALISRQNNLFAAEDWKIAYKAFSEVDFQAYDFDTVRASLIEYIRTNFPETFNDYIESYYLDNSDGYEILSMLEEIDMGQDFEDYNKKPK